jgi:hypothetical protein
MDGDTSGSDAQQGESAANYISADRLASACCDLSRPYAEQLLLFVLQFVHCSPDTIGKRLSFFCQERLLYGLQFLRVP